MKYIVIADVHFKSTNAVALYNELKSGVYHDIESSEDGEYDVVVVSGDYFNHKMLLNEIGSTYAIRFMNELIELCKSKNIIVRVIRGTKTHDYNQLETFRHLENHYFKIINSVSSETYNGHSILYVPEEYMEDQDEYYKDYFDKTYDSVFFHGTWSFVANVANHQEGERHIHSAPVFKLNELENLANGYIIGGHIHIHMVHQDKVIYVGPYTRNNFAELQDVGYLIYEYDKDKNIREYKFIKNELAPEYKKIKFTDLDGDTFEDKVNAMKALSKDKNTKVEFSNSDFANESEFHILKNTFSNTSNIKLDIKNEVIEDKDEDNPFNFINDSSLTEEEVISKYILLKSNKEISPNLIKDILSSK